MAKAVLYVGYGSQKETAPGVFDDAIVEKRYFGDTMWDNRRYNQTTTVNDDLSLNVAFSILADSYANTNFNNIRYIKYQGNRWRVTAVEVEPPRLKLYAGGVYNGPTPAGAP